MNRRNVFITLGCVAIVPIAALLSLHRSYSPGPVSAGHARFVAQCSACHEPWRGVSNRGCIDCHGDYEDQGNPHKSANLAGKDTDLVPGRVIRAFFSEADKTDKLSCLSCHTDHRGRHPDLTFTAASNCTFCHEHAGIDDVTAHTKKVERPTGSRLAFKTSFTHSKEFDLLKKRDHSLRYLPCGSCHELKRTPVGEPEQFLLSRGGLALIGLPPTPSPSSSSAPPAAPPSAGAPTQAAASVQAPAPAQQEDDFARIWDSVPATTDSIPIFESLRYVNGSFTHSPAHLSYRCGACHEDIQKKSKRAGDPAAREVESCFNCHASKPPEKTPAVTAARAGLLFAGAPLADAEDTAPKPKEPQYKTCAECHAFHVHGNKPDRDFPAKASSMRPHPSPGIRFAVSSRSPIQIWLLGLFGLVLTGFGAASYFRWAASMVQTKSAESKAARALSPEIPALDDSFQSSVERLYIVGETAGTASVNLAMRSGRQAIEFIADRLKAETPAAEPEVYDVAIIGCGPAGISAAAMAKQRGLSYLAIEKTTAASTIRDYPRKKFVQATPLDLKEYGMEFYMEGDNDKEKLLEQWEIMLRKTNLALIEREEVQSIARRGLLFELATRNNKTYKARFIALAIGVRGSPRRLNLPGETAERVFYKLVEPEEYQDKHILVAGGGNSGAEVAQALANPELRNTVGYSFRDVVLGPPVSPENAEKISALQQKGYLTVYPSSEIKEIKPGRIVLAPRAPKPGAARFTAAPGAVLLTEPAEIENDFIFAMLGAEPPAPFLKSIGVRLTRKGR